MVNRTPPLSPDPGSELEPLSPDPGSELEPLSPDPGSELEPLSPDPGSELEPLSPNPGSELYPAAAAAQLLLAWARSRGTSAVFKSANPARISENTRAAAAGVLGAAVTSEALSALSALPQLRRYTGSAFVGREKACGSLAELWD